MEDTDEQRKVRKVTMVDDVTTQRRERPSLRASTLEHKKQVEARIQEQEFRRVHLSLFSDVGRR
jgi:myo-inositol catabolism protein IolC